MITNLCKYTYLYCYFALHASLPVSFLNNRMIILWDLDYVVSTVSNKLKINLHLGSLEINKSLLFLQYVLWQGLLRPLLLNNCIITKTAYLSKRPQCSNLSWNKMLFLNRAAFHRTHKPNCSY